MVARAGNRSNIPSMAQYATLSRPRHDVRYRPEFRRRPMTARLSCRGRLVLLDNRRYHHVMRRISLLGNSSTAEQRTLTPLI